MLRLYFCSVYNMYIGFDYFLLMVICNVHCCPVCICVRISIHTHTKHTHQWLPSPTAWHGRCMRLALGLSQSCLSERRREPCGTDGGTLRVGMETDLHRNSSVASHRRLMLPRCYLDRSSVAISNHQSQTTFVQYSHKQGELGKFYISQTDLTKALFISLRQLCLCIMFYIS